jgi:TetR/AcrR family transcriptional repressor of nem operon
VRRLRDAATARTGLIDSYLSARQRDAPGTGCAVVTLGAAAGRGEAEMKEAYEKQVRSYLELISETADGDDSDEVQADAMLTLSAMVGALLMSRAVADPELSDQLLQTVAARLKRAPVNA